MDLHRAADKVLTEAEHVVRALDADRLTPDRIDLALSGAKRVRRDATLLVRQLAAHRDATTQEGTST